MLSFFTGPERPGITLSEAVLLGFCFTACAGPEITEISETGDRSAASTLC